MSGQLIIAKLSFAAACRCRERQWSNRVLYSGRTQLSSRFDIRCTRVRLCEWSSTHEPAWCIVILCLVSVVSNASSGVWVHSIRPGVLREYTVMNHAALRHIDEIATYSFESCKCIDGMKSWEKSGMGPRRMIPPLLRSLYQIRT